MRTTQEILREIEMTQKDMRENRAQTHQELPSPDCYALPLLAFLIGVTCHKVLPAPADIVKGYLFSRHR